MIVSVALAAGRNAQHHVQVNTASSVAEVGSRKVVVEDSPYSSVSHGFVGEASAGSVVAWQWQRHWLASVTQFVSAIQACAH